MAGEAAANTGGTASAFRSAVTSGALNTAPTAPAPAAVPNMPAAPVANDNARQPMVAPGDDASVADQLYGESDGEDGVAEIEAAQDAAEPDATEPQADPFAEVMYDDGKGKVITAKDVLESLKNGVLPPELMDKISFELPVNGVKTVLTASELGKGFMRHADYTKKTQEVQEQRRDNEAFQTGFDAACDNALKDSTGGELRRLMRRMGLGQALYNAAVSIATEEEAVSRMPPEARDYYRKMKALEEEKETLAEQARMHQETASDKKRRAQQAAFQREYDSMTPMAMQRAGLKGTPSHVNAYKQALKVLLREPGARLSLDLCIQAAQTAREELADLAQQFHAEAAAPTSPAAAEVRAAQQARQQPQGLSPRRTAPAPVTGGGGVNSATGGTPGQFRKFLTQTNRR